MYSVASVTDVLLFRSWPDLAAKKRKEAQKQITITDFLKRLSFTNLHYVKSFLFVCEIFSFDAVLYIFFII
jgi:hypothetical protein